MNLHDIARGDSPLVIDVPHAGTRVPRALAAQLTPEARPLPDTDWHVDKLYAFARAAGATLVVATHSRYVVDLNRDPAGASLYPGADVTELCPTRTFASEPIWLPGGAPDAAAIAARRAEWFDPYHAALAAEVERVRRRHGYVLLLDGHSIRSEVPRFFRGRLPDLNLGTANGASCAPGLETAVVRALGAAPGLHPCRQRPLHGRVRHPALRPPRGRHSRAAARGRAGVLYGRGATLRLGRRARGRAGRRAASRRRRAGWLAAGPGDGVEWVGEGPVIRFYTARNRFDAYLLADRLKQAGIRAHVFNEHASSIVGEIPPDVGQPQVWLEREQDRERALLLLSRIEDDAQQTGVRRCGGCGEESPASFDLCWNCGRGLQLA